MPKNGSLIEKGNRGILWRQKILRLKTKIVRLKYETNVKKKMKEKKSEREREIIVQTQIKR